VFFTVLSLAVGAFLQWRGKSWRMVQLFYYFAAMEALQVGGWRSIDRCPHRPLALAATDPPPPTPPHPTPPHPTPPHAPHGCNRRLPGDRRL